MPRLIKDGAIVTDDWQLLSEEEATESVSKGKIILPLKLWQEQAREFDNKVGVWIDGDTDLSSVGNRIARLPLIAIKFPGFMDGRGFSTGRLLRERYQFTGELRAIGHIIRDQLCYLRRCGFTAFQFGEDEDLDAALHSLNDFQEYYQAAVDEPLPLFRRRRS
jgi:uncharacterized protein (DUF934 family)